MEPTFSSGLVWFRRDLRSDDHAALHHALRQCAQVHCVFVFDKPILDPLPRADRRVEFIRESLVELDASLRELSGHPHGGLIVRHAVAAEEIPALAGRLGVEAVFANHDDEPAALERDTRVRHALAAGVRLLTYKDHTLFERAEILTQGGTPYTVFTPYKNAWLRKVDDFYLSAYPVESRGRRLAPRPEWARGGVPPLADIGFEPAGLDKLPLPPGMAGARTLFEDFLARIDRYDDARDFPAVKGPSYLSVHLRFGTLSPRLAARTAHARMQKGSAGAATWLSELIWRDFYFQILAHYPQVAGGASFKPAYDAIAWEDGAEAKEHFAAWCAGRTGYPLVDAAMAQIKQTGYMHNRLRMVVASFLVKDLGVDWRWGERYFAEKLNDFDLSANNGGWQWASSSGCDAQPYFRIFNPVSQSRKFDPKGRFIRAYLPQLAALPDAHVHAPWEAGPLEREAAGVRLGDNYPHPLVEHGEARQRTLERYAVVKANTGPA
ncbi:cryptochrome/photolyase family protein [Paracidovorax konjaci]|nr:deoxyribodipyrimidine photo-lyase [Paracidovorax konjaci]